MDIKEIYTKLPYDTSGSMAKNRFQYEKMFGLIKMFDSYELYEDYTVVFDYVCDIELHTNEKLSFYQIKTKSDYSPITNSYLTKKDKNSLHSIIAKLYLIRCENKEYNDKIELNIVGNVPFKDDTNLCKVELKKFSEMSEKTQETITSAIKNELNIDNVDIDNLYYIFNSIDLNNYEDTMLGKTLKFYNKVIGVDSKKPNVLYATLKSIIDDKASVEKANLSYDELINQKGFTKKELEKLLNCHKQTNELIEKCNDYLRKRFNNLKDGITISNTLKKIIDKNDLLYEKEKVKIQEYIKETYLNNKSDDNEYIERYINSNMNSFPIEYSFIEKYTYVYYEILKYVEEQNEENKF